MQKGGWAAVRSFPFCSEIAVVLVAAVVQTTGALGKIVLGFVDAAAAAAADIRKD